MSIQISTSIKKLISSINNLPKENPSREQKAEIKKLAKTILEELAKPGQWKEIDKSRQKYKGLLCVSIIRANSRGAFSHFTRYSFGITSDAKTLSQKVVEKLSYHKVYKIPNPKVIEEVPTKRPEIPKLQPHKYHIQKEMELSTTTFLDPIEEDKEALFTTTRKMIPNQRRCVELNGGSNRWIALPDRRTEGLKKFLACRGIH